MINDKILTSYLNVISESNSSQMITDDFENNLNDAILKNEIVKFKYTKKDGSSYVVTVLPTQIFTSKGQTAIKGYLNGIQDPSKERMFYINAMGENASVTPPAEELNDNKLTDLATTNANAKKILDIRRAIMKANKNHDYIVFINKKGQMKGGRNIKICKFWDKPTFKGWDDLFKETTNDEEHPFGFLKLSWADNRKDWNLQIDDIYNTLRVSGMHQRGEDINNIDFIVTPNTSYRKVTSNFKEEFRKAAAEFTPVSVRIQNDDLSVTDINFLVLLNGIWKEGVSGLEMDENGKYIKPIYVKWKSLKNPDEIELMTADEGQALKKANDAKWEADFKEYMANLTPEEKKACKGWGFLNGLRGNEEAEFREACKIHARLCKEHPEFHVNRNEQLGRCRSSDRCSCGFGYAVDSSD